MGQIFNIWQEESVPHCGSMRFSSFFLLSRQLSVIGTLLNYVNMVYTGIYFKHVTQPSLHIKCVYRFSPFIPLGTCYHVTLRVHCCFVPWHREWRAAVCSRQKYTISLFQCCPAMSLSGNQVMYVLWVIMKRFWKGRMHGKKVISLVSLHLKPYKALYTFFCCFKLT